MIRYIAMYGAYVAFLHAVPGPWRKWSKGQVVDWWTVMHVAWGALAERTGLSIQQLMVLTTANEIGEAGIRKYRPDLLWGTPEPWPNVAMDLVFTAMGHKLARGRAAAARLAHNQEVRGSSPLPAKIHTERQG